MIFGIGSCAEGMDLGLRDEKVIYNDGQSLWISTGLPVIPLTMCKVFN